MIVAVEDALSEAVARRLASHACPHLGVTAVLGYQGKGYVRSKARELNRSARSLKVFALVDQDSPAACPGRDIRAWLGGEPNAGLVFRMAVLEVESWLLSDHKNLAKYLQIRQNDIPVNPDTVIGAKEVLVALARNSRSRRIRESIVPEDGSSSAVGALYNQEMTAFATQSWDPAAAAIRSPSLLRTLARLTEL